MISSIVLHGRLKEEFGERHFTACSTPADAFHGLDQLRPGFLTVVRQGEYRVIRGHIDTGFDLDETGLHLRLAPGGELHLIPVAAGSKNGGIGKIILGSVIAVAAVAGGVLSGGAGFLGLAGASPLFGVTYGSIALFGASLVIGGVLDLLSPQKKTTTNSKADVSTGISNVASEGSVIPTVYGRCMTGSVVVSAGYTTEDWTATARQVAFENETGGYSGNPAITNDTNFNNLGDSNQVGGQGAKGSGKGGGGSGSGASDTPNTLRSQGIVRLIDVISEGPIGGLVGNAQGILFNGVPLQNSDGSFNFDGVMWEARTGEPDQPPVNGFPAAESTQTINVTVLQDQPVVEVVNNPDATACRVTIEIPSLYIVNESDGSMAAGPDLGLAIQISVDGGNTYGAPVVTDLFHGQKCVSAYQKSYRVNLPAQSTDEPVWYIRLTKTTQDYVDFDNIACTLQWSEFDTITDHQLIYPNTAYVALTIDSETFGASVPTRTYLVDGLIIPIPENYDPVARTYASTGPGTNAGTWDGVSWSTAVCDDPAWQVLDLIQNSRYGLAMDASAVALAAYDLYTVSQYCSAQITDGFGGTEPRYSTNVSLTDQQDAFRMIQQFCSAFRGLSFWKAGSVAFVADMPKSPVQLVTNAHVQNGEFQYEGTSLKTRHTASRITWRDPANKYQETIEFIQDYDTVAQQGLKIADITGFGVTSRGLARRLGRWLLDSERYKTQTVTYVCGLDHLQTRPGDVVAVADQYYAGVRTGGRISSASNGNPGYLLLDNVVSANPGDTIMFTNSAGQVQTSEIISISTQTSASGRQQSLVGVAGWTWTVQPDAAFVIVTVTAEPQLYSVVSIEEQTGGVGFKVTGIWYDPGSFNRVEEDLPFVPSSYSTLPALLASPLSPPSNVQVQSAIFGLGATTQLQVIVSWTPTTDPRVTGYQVRAVSDTNETQYFNADPGSTITITTLAIGNYVFSVRSMDTVDNITSAWVSTAELAVNGSSAPPPQVVDVVAVGGTRQVSLSWQDVGIRNLRYYEVRRANVNDFSQAQRITYINATGFVDADSNALQPLTTWYYWIAAIDTLNQEGPFSNPVSATTTVLLYDDLAAAIANTAKFAQGLLNSIGTPLDITSMADAPSNLQAGQIVYSEQEQMLYRSNGDGSFSVYEPFVADSQNQLTAAEIASVNAASIEGTLTANQIASLTAAQLTGQIETSQVTPGAITTPLLAAAAVQTANIAAGAVTAATLAIGSPTNVIWNPSFYDSTAGWIGYYYDGSNSNAPGTDNFLWEPARVATPSNYLDGEGGLVVLYGGSNTVTNKQIMVTYWHPEGDLQGVPVVPGTMVAGSVYVTCANSCEVSISIEFFDANGNTVSSQNSLNGSGASNVYGNLAQPQTAMNLKSLSNFTRIGLLAVVPANAVSALFLIVGAGYAGGSQYPAYAIARAMFGTVPANSTQIPDYAPGGVTTIAGDMIKTGTLNASKIVANSITASQIAASSITGDRIAADTITAGNIAAQAIVAGLLAANAVTAGTIAAGAVAASQIAANQIYGYHMAAAEIISEQAQLGNLVVNTIHVVDEAITTYATCTMATQNGGGGNYNVASLTMNVIGDQPGILWASWQQGFSTANPSTGFAITQQSSQGTSQIVNRGGEGQVNDLPSISVPVTLYNGANTFTFTWEAASGAQLISGTMTCLTRLK